MIVTSAAVPAVVGRAIIGKPLFLVLETPFKETTSLLSGFVIIIDIPFAVSMLEPPPIATITSAPISLHIWIPAFTFEIGGFGSTSWYTPYSIPASSKIFVTFLLTPTS